MKHNPQPNEIWCFDDKNIKKIVRIIEGDYVETLQTSIATEPIGRKYYANITMPAYDHCWYKADEKTTNYYQAKLL